MIPSVEIGSVGIIGASGAMGSGLALRLSRAGVAVIAGCRDVSLAQLKLASIADDITFGSYADAAMADCVIFTVPWGVLPETALSLAHLVIDKTVISIGNRLHLVGNCLMAIDAPSSYAQTLQGVLEDSHVATAFNHVSALALADLNVALTADVLICTDSEAAFNQTAEVVSLVGLHPMRAGGLAVARYVEDFTAVVANTNKANKQRFSIKMVQQ